MGSSAPIHITTTIEETRRAVADARRRGLTVGLVPTMGALHAGHAGLLRTARAECGHVVASIFVNPTQFGPHEDLSRYPRPFAVDVKKCGGEQVDLVFHPEPATMYPAGFHTYVEVMELPKGLCGAGGEGDLRRVAREGLTLL